MAQYLPPMVAKWKRDALRWYRLDTIYFGNMYNEVRERIVSKCVMLTIAMLTALRLTE